MRDEFDRLRLAVDEATTQVIDATSDLNAARAVEADARAKREAAEQVRNAALQRLTESRAALDASLGIVQAPRVALPPRPFQPSTFEDDDEPIRDP